MPIELIDNVNRLLGDSLKQSIARGMKLKIAASCFSIYAFEALKAELEKIESLEFIFTSPTFIPDEVTDADRKVRREFFIPKAARERGFYGSEFEIQLKNKLTQRAIAKECADWMRRKAKFRSNRGQAPMQQFLCLDGASKDGGSQAVYQPLHGFTAVDLGYQRGNAVSNFVNRIDEPAFAANYLNLFDQVWNDPARIEDVTERLCDHIATVYQENSPERIYFMMLYNIFSEFLENLSEDVLPNDLTGYKDSLIWNKLYNFQRDAAMGIINKLETYNGCILADSVGLGKTFTALAVIKYYELRNRSVLVLCPKKLADNWLNFNRNLTTNLFARDRLRYDVLCHTDLLRTTGESFGTPLNRINWGNYDLVVIDESHNFRNNDVFKDRETRYQRLLNSVIRQGVKTKVLMLSATPVNNRFSDLRNQLALAYEGESETLREKIGITKDVEEVFLEDYGKRARFFIYDSKQPHNLESYSSDGGINAMIINVQAFAARGEDARRIYMELDDFQSRRPIDVIKQNRPILILDEPQKMEGKKTLESLKEFNPLMILRYSATHKTQHNKVHRLDALDAYNQKLVKKIAVRGISTRGFTGTNAYLYLESIEVSTTKPPTARLEMEVQIQSGIKRETRRVGKNDNLHELSGGLRQYKGFVISDVDAVADTVSFSNGHVLHSGEASGDADEMTLRRIQIRESIKAHLEKEQSLFDQGIKTLTLFFIDEVAKYRKYDKEGEQPGEYARIFEEEYARLRDEAIDLFSSKKYVKYLKGIDVSRTHNGYFSIDKKSKRLVDPSVAARGELAGQTDDVDAYDLILKDKERLLSLEEPVRFIFSHSALREGWDNPNVFVIGTLKHSDNTVSRRQEVGRGMRLAVVSEGPLKGERMDDPATVHQVNVLTVVASESYKDFVAGLQKDISASLSERPRMADEAYFAGKTLRTEAGDVVVTPQMAKQLYQYLVKNDYVDDQDAVVAKYHEAKKNGSLAPLPDLLKTHEMQVFQLVDSVFSDAQLPAIDNDRASKVNPLSRNFEKKEFQDLWNRINQKAVYAVQFETTELVGKCVKALDKELTVSPLQYTVQRGEQTAAATAESLKKGEAFVVRATETTEHRASVHSAVKYDLLGAMAEKTQLLRGTIAAVLTAIRKETFAQFPTNPEDFILKAARIVNEQKATVIIERLTYDPIEERYGVDIFTQAKPKESFAKATKADRHIYDYVFTDSTVERKFVQDLDTSTDVVVYAKLPRNFFIPTPVGNYNPDWAIAFKQGQVKHVYFVAETKGTLSSLELREIEDCKIQCARKFFAKITSDQVRYDVVDSYGKLMELVK